MKVYTLVLEEAQVNQILFSVAERPYREVSNLMAALYSQCNAQNAQPNPPSVPAGPGPAGSGSAAPILASALAGSGTPPAPPVS